MTTQHTTTDLPPLPMDIEDHPMFADEVVAYARAAILLNRGDLVAALQEIAEAVQFGIKDADVRAECGEIARAALAKVSA